MSENDVRQSGSSQYIGDFPGILSNRAQAFIAMSSHRVSYDRQLAGEALRDAIRNVHGEIDYEIADLLAVVQGRYGGLTYESGYFGNTATYTPVCEPEADEELDILYAIQTGTSAGASLDPRGAVQIGWDERRTSEFSSLDQVIEWDANFDAAERMPIFRTFHMGNQIGVDRARALLSSKAIEVSEVPLSSGRNTFWLSGPELLLSINSVWVELGLPMPPVVYVGATTEGLIDTVRDLLRC